MVNWRLAGLPYFGALAQARPGDRETVLGFMYPIYVSAELKTKKIAVATLTYKKKIHICTNVSYIYVCT